MVEIRAFADGDFETLVSQWHDTNLVSYPYVEAHRRHTLSDARSFFKRHVLPECEVWVATEADALLGFIALSSGWIRQLTVFAEHQRRGVGTQLLRRVQERSPVELRLYTFQRNAPARAFYVGHGFEPVAFGISPSPENEPDVEYLWRSDPYIKW